MSQNDLSNLVSQAAQVFARQIVEILNQATLQELTELQTETKPRRRGRKPARVKVAVSETPKVRKKPGPKPGKKKAKPAVKAAKATVKKAKQKNYPKCAYPGCNKNRFVRGKGFCGDHWQQWKEGKIKAAEEYKK